jgi:glutamate synthase domain-containing protein 2
MLSMKEIDKLKKNSLLKIEISPNTKTSIVNSNLNQLVTDLKRISSKKDVIVLVLEQ